MTATNSRCHIVGSPCFARPRGCGSRWLLAEVIQAWPLRVRVTEADPVWHGAELTQADANIRVSPVQWPAERRVS